MNATMSLRLEKELKDDFSSYAKQLGVEPSMLVRKFMSSCLTRHNAVTIDIDEALFDEIVVGEQSKDKLKTLATKIQKLGF